MRVILCDVYPMVIRFMARVGLPWGLTEFHTVLGWDSRNWLLRTQEV